MYGQPRFGVGFRWTPVVRKLIIANVAVFGVQLLLGAVGFGGVDVQYFSFRPDRVFVQFWGAFTYMFLHGSVGHLLLNMLVLFFFGPPLESRWGGREFFRFYVIAGLGGVALSFIFSPSSPVIGASAACYGLMLAFAMNWPKAPIYIYAIFPVQARFLVGFFFLMSLWQGFADQGGNVAHFAHLGGILAAFLYLKADWRPARFAQNVKQKAKARPRKLVVVPRQDASDDDAPVMPEREERKVLDEVDRVLDKISAHGISSLTEEERRLLDEVSRRRRTN